MLGNDVLDFYSANTDTAVSLPFFKGGVSAGFPSPAEDFLENELDFNATFIKHPSATFYAKVKGNSMKDAGISNGDIMVIDKSLEPNNGDIAVCYLDGEFTVKTIRIEKDIVWLIAQNEQYEPIKVTAENELIIWGIVINVIKTFRK